MNVLSPLVDTTTGPINVLHVDDEPELADLTATFLEREDERFEVTTAMRASDGLDHLAEEPVDCIVSDYEMPGMDGIEFLETVREEYPDLPFVLFTGKGSEEVASDAISAGVTDYLQKERGTDQYTVLANRISNAIEHYQSRQMVERSEQRLREIIDAVPHIMHVVDADGTYLLANEALATFYDTTVEEIEGAHITDILGESTAEQFRENLTAVLRSGTEKRTSELTVTDGTGEEHVLEPLLLPYELSGSDEQAVLGVAVDVTERKHRERELERTRERMELALEHTDSVVFEIDRSSGETVRHGAYEQFFDLRASDVSTWEEHLENAVHPDDREQFRTFYERLIDGDRDEGTLEYRTHPLRGGVRWIRDTVSVRSVPTDDGHRVVGIAHDITERKERELELRRKERQYQAVFNDPNILVGLVDTDGTVRDINQTAMDYIEPTLEEITGGPLWETPWFDHAQDLQRAVKEWVDRAADGEYVAFEADLVRQTGEPYTVEGVFRPVTDDDGEVVSLLISDHDITERKEREAELERMRDFFTEAERLGNLGAWEFSASGDLVWTDGTRRIHEVDDAFEPTLEEAIRMFHPEDRESIEQAVENALQNGESFQREVRLITAKDNQRWVRTRGSVRSETEQQTVRGFIQDITERKEREEELRQINAQLENAIEAGTVGTWEWQIAENRLVVGKEFARRFGVDPDSAQEGVELDRFTSSIHEDDREWVEEEIQAAIEACGEYEAEYRVWDVDGELNWVLARGHVECDGTGSAVRFPGILVDITERKRIEQELQRQNERLSEFASVVSHDLRNPLNVIKGRLEILQEEDDSEHLDAIGRAQERMDALITDLLILAREGETTTDRTPIGLADCIHQCWQNVVTADATLVDDLDRVIRADKNRLSQLFENLIRNAVEHGGGDVTVTIGELDDGFYVEDDGPGIPEAERETIFDMGYSTHESGTGFGLSIVEQVVDAHGWEINVTEGSAGGARFEITGVEFVPA